MSILLKILKSLANENRLKIVEILQRRKKVDLYSLAKLLHVSTSSACQHLKKLELNYMVKHKIIGHKAFYSLNSKRPLRFNRSLLTLLKKQRKRFL